MDIKELIARLQDIDGSNVDVRGIFSHGRELEGISLERVEGDDHEDMPRYNLIIEFG